jgi:hypothetical protein
LTPWRSPLLGAALVLSATAAAAPAFAQPASWSDALAQKRFEEGRQLMSEGKLAEACPKFEESDRVGPSGGAVMNLAECYEKQGRVASAHAKYLEAASRAAAAKRPDIEAVARNLAKKLESHLTRVVIAVPPEVDRPSLEVRRDKVAVPRSDWGKGIYVDPGTHTVEAIVPGEKGWQTSFTVSANATADTVTLTVQLGGGATKTATAEEPPHQDTPTPPVPVEPPRPPPESEPANKGSTQRVLGLSAAGAGVIALGVGTVFALSASSKRSDVESNCPGGRCKDASFVTMNDDAKSSANTATILFVVGGVLAAGGGVLFFTAPPSTTASAAAASRPRLAAFALPGGGVATLVGSW